MLRKVWLYKYRGLSKTILASKSRCGPLPFNALENVFKTSSFQTNKIPYDCKGSLMQMALDLRVPVLSPQGKVLARQAGFVPSPDSAKALQKWGRKGGEGPLKRSGIL